MRVDFYQFLNSVVEDLQFRKTIWLLFLHRFGQTIQKTFLILFNGYLQNYYDFLFLFLLFLMIELDFVTYLINHQI